MPGTTTASNAANSSADSLPFRPPQLCLQFHENIRLEDPDRFFAPGGAVEAVARRGKEE
jgi:hypothetical protein